MDAERSRHEYERRIHRVLAHVDAHLADPLHLETLAAVACFSPFHFHRLFRAVVGETLGDYLRRRRVEIAATRLAAEPGLPVLAVALDVGFGSGEAFARAFRQRFGRSPSAWREDRKSGQADRKPGQAAALRGADDGGSATRPSSEPPMNVSVVDRTPTPVAYFRHVGPYGPGIARFWIDTVAPWMERNGLVGRVRYGVSHDDPSVTDPAKCRYDACVELAPDAPVDGRPQRTVLAGGRYACLRFEGPPQTIDAAWDRLLQGWLPASGLQLDARPFLEHYPADVATGRAHLVCDLCIPVRPL